MIMKAIKYIAAIAMLAGLVSCQQDMTQEIQTLQPETDAVKISFNVQFPEPIPVNTKGQMAEGPLKTEPFNISLCLYGSGEGYIQHWIPAEMDTPITSGNYITGGQFTVLLPLSDEKRIVHIIANPPFEVDAAGNYIYPTSEYYYDVLETMISQKGTDNEASYWQEIVLENGIKADNGRPAQDVIDAFSDIHLVRNYARINVAGNPDEYITVTRWALINVPDKAYVAPYNGDHSLTFPTGYTGIAGYPDGDDLLNQLMVNDAYPGYFPSETSIIDTFPGDPDDPASASNYSLGSESQYMYERPLPTSSHKQTAALMEVSFGEEHPLTIAYNEDHEGEEGFPKPEVSYWYKVEILDSLGQYVPFLRSISYTLMIQGIESAGEETALEAFDGPYFGNISASLETASLNRLSDGKSTIYVDLMDYTFLTAPEEEFTLMKNEDDASIYWFVPDEAAIDPDTGSPYYYYTSEAGVCDIQVELLTVSGYEPALAQDPTVVGDGSLKIKLNNPDESKIKKSIIRISGRKGDNTATNTERYIYREIMINLMSKQTFAHGNDTTHFTNVEGLDGPGKQIDLSIFLPEDLGASVFPIQVRIEAENNSLSAVSSDLPVRTGKTVFDPYTRNTYFFVRTIQYSEYRTLNPRTKKYEFHYEFPVTFYTSKTGDNSTKVDIRDMNGDFIPMELTLPVTP